MITARQGLIPMTRWFAPVPVLLVLFVCSSSQPVRLAQARVVAPSSPAPLAAVKRTQPKQEKPKSADPDREARLAAFPVHSPEWWVVLGAIEAEEDARLAKLLVICKGCFDRIGDSHPDQSNR
jgi:hypothetical protein